jgi:hypothetical protein
MVCVCVLCTIYWMHYIRLAQVGWVNWPFFFNARVLFSTPVETDCLGFAVFVTVHVDNTSGIYRETTMYKYNVQVVGLIPERIEKDTHVCWWID